jgi:hypothetical protein
MKQINKLAFGALSALLASAVTVPASAQLPEHLRDYNLATRGATGEAVAPMFNGWFKNGDGSVTMMFGFANQNREQIVNVPLGSNNFIEPAEFDGAQPTHFPVYDRGGFIGVQERGAFAVTVPADQADTEVVWTLTSGGKTYSVPGRATSTAYELSRAPAAFGSLRPAIRFEKNGPEAIDSEGVYAERITASVGEPVTLMAYAQDRGEREGYEVDSLTFPVGSEWLLHQGPAIPDFQPVKVSGEERGANGEGSLDDGWTVVQTQATFWEPGDYVVRLRIDNFEAPDSKFDNVCCWTNAFVPVTVTQ